MSNRMLATSEELLDYVHTDPSRWRALHGGRIRYLGIGWADVAPLESATKFRLTFDTGEEILVGLDAFASGQITHIKLDPFPSDFSFHSSHSKLQRQRAESQPSCIHSVPSEAPKLDSLQTDPNRLIREAIRAKTGNVHNQQGAPTLEAVAIRNICLERGITKVVHFARVANLRSILEKGLMSRAVLEQLPIPDRPIFNDDLRADGHRDAISVSISFPNYKMFYSLRKADKSTVWVVLEIDASILWERSCAFCSTNAADRSMSQIPISERMTAASFEHMFSDLPDKPRSMLGIQPHFPTNPQAEVLIFGKIETSRIGAICFPDGTSMRQWLGQQRENRNYPSVTIQPSYFDARSDYMHWPAATQAGIPAYYEEPQSVWGATNNDIPF